MTGQAPPQNIPGANQTVTFEVTDAFRIKVANSNLGNLKDGLAELYAKRAEILRKVSEASKIANSVKTLAASAEVARLVSLRENIDQGLMLVLAEAVFKGHKFTTQDLQFLQLKLGGLTEQEKVADQAVRTALVASVINRISDHTQAVTASSTNLQARTTTILELLGCMYKQHLISKLPAIPVAPPTVPTMPTITPTASAPPTIPDPSAPIVPDSAPTADEATPDNLVKQAETASRLAAGGVLRVLMDAGLLKPDPIYVVLPTTKAVYGALAIGAVWYFTRKK
jgi:hypothetical protein